ncbi:MAG: GNAT family N-acetyltransferase, partial [Pirellulales bacterium]
FEEAPGVVRATLRLDGRPVAMCWACRWEGRVDALGLAFTGAAGDHSPARVLLGRWIADAQARGDRTVLFGPGWPDWITGCCTLTRGSVRYTHFPVTARAQVARWSRWTPAATA